MRVLLFCFIAPLISCHELVSSAFVTHHVALKNGLGQLSIELPANLDTTYRWTYNGDNSCDSYEMNRFANKEYSLLQESRWISEVLPDSLLQVTVTYNSENPCLDKSEINLDYIDALEKVLLASNPRVKVELKEVRTIHNRNYAVIVYTAESDLGNSNQNLEDWILSAATIIEGNNVQVTYRCFKENCSDFKEKMKISLNTVKIVNAELELDSIEQIQEESSNFHSYKSYSQSIDQLIEESKFGQIELLVHSEYMGNEVELCLNAGGFIDYLKREENMNYDNIFQLIKELFEGGRLFQMTPKRAEHFKHTIIDLEYYKANFSNVDLSTLIKRYFSKSTSHYNGNNSKFYDDSRNPKETRSLIKYLIMNDFEVSTGSYSGGYDVVDLTRNGRLEIKH